MLARGVLLAALTFTCACSTGAHQPTQAERQGDTYFKKDRFHLALPYYEEALAEAPDNSALQERLDETKRGLFEYRKESSRQSLNAGQYAAALDSVERAVDELGADYPGVAELRQETALRIESVVESAYQARRFRDAYTAYQALLTSMPDLAKRGRDGLSYYRKAWLEQLSQRAKKDEAERLWGSAMLTWAKMASIYPDDIYVERRDALRARILDDYTYNATLDREITDKGSALVFRWLEAHDFPAGVSITAPQNEGPKPTATISVRFKNVICYDTESNATHTCEAKLDATIRRTDLRVEPVVLTEQLRATEPGKHSNVWTEPLFEQMHADAARLIIEGIDTDFERYRTQLLDRGARAPLERAKIDALIVLITLDSEAATNERIARIQKVSGFENVAHLLALTGQPSR